MESIHRYNKDVYDYHVETNIIMTSQINTQQEPEKPKSNQALLEQLTTDLTSNNQVQPLTIVDNPIQQDESVHLEDINNIKHKLAVKNKLDDGYNLYTKDIKDNKSINKPLDKLAQLKFNILNEEFI